MLTLTLDGAGRAWCIDASSRHFVSTFSLPAISSTLDLNEMEGWTKNNFIVLRLSFVDDIPL